MHFECASRTDVGLVRKINEDSIFVDPTRGLWAVADGMGGHEAGEVASAMMIDALRCLPRTRDINELAIRAVEALREVNRDLIALAQSAGHGRTIGTTVVGLAIAEDSFRCFWAGDSRGYRMRKGELSRLTHDHSLVQDLVDAGMLTEAEAETHENANVVTRAVGAAERIDPDVVGGDAAPGDRFLLASDGLTRLVRDQELTAQLGAGTPAEAADKLMEMALARGAPDNVSLIVVDIA
jgi:serine/threonine protein phosphatase PrpC